MKSPPDGIFFVDYSSLVIIELKESGKKLADYFVINNFENGLLRRVVRSYFPAPDYLAEVAGDSAGASFVNKKYNSGTPGLLAINLMNYLVTDQSLLKN